MWEEGEGEAKLLLYRGIQSSTRKIRQPKYYHGEELAAKSHGNCDDDDSDRDEKNDNSVIDLCSSSDEDEELTRNATIFQHSVHYFQHGPMRAMSAALPRMQRRVKRVVLLKMRLLCHLKLRDWMWRWYYFKARMNHLKRSWSLYGRSWSRGRMLLSIVKKVKLEHGGYK